jgi:8-oxo-dGTP pyrophosphatase MutT (NUDIX family)
MIQQQPNKYRSFIFVLHETYGILLLHCTRKIKKGFHYQIPGGHVDEEDFINVKATTTTTTYRNQSNDIVDSNESKVLQIAGMVGALRELYEETGIDLRTDMVQSPPVEGSPCDETTVPILPLQLYETTATTMNESAVINSSTNDEGLSKLRHKLPNEYKHRLFYTVLVTDDILRSVVDHTSHQPTGSSREDVNDINNTCKASNHPPPPHIRLKLSHEHSGYTFVKDINTIQSMIGLHSGGAIAKAFRMACIIKARYGTDDDPWKRILSGLSIDDDNQHLAPTNHNAWNDDESKVHAGDDSDNDDA